MATLELPAPVTAHEAMRFTLQGAVYVFVWRWNERASAWTLDLQTETGAPIVDGLQLPVGIDLLRQHHHLAVPPGQLAVVDTLGLGVMPGFEWAPRWKLLYVEATT